MKIRATGRDVCDFVELITEAHARGFKIKYGLGYSIIYICGGK